MPKCTDFFAEVDNNSAAEYIHNTEDISFEFQSIQINFKPLEVTDTTISCNLEQRGGPKPPPGPPAAPAFKAPKIGGGGPTDRGALLQSIQKGNG